MHRLKILDTTGHTEISWKPDDVEELRSVQERFDELMKRSFVAFDLSTSPGERIHEFRPHATEIVVAPRFAGG
ncbi:MAG: hypothetical protein JOY59_09540 [Candidatus Eremiobacteraeota bacterium]|nr:hypothetical protein [Candidatus Eremiobacteraeota bacterium]